MVHMSFPRRQQYRRLRRAAASGTAGLVAGAFAVIAAGAGALPVAGVLLLVTSGLMIDARRWLRLASRSRIGARSEDEVRRALAPLEAEGWRLRHSLPYRGRGDIDSVAIAPSEIAFAIETKARTFDARHLASVREMAAWLYRRRRRWCRRAALPVLCVVRARGVERVQDGSWSSQSTASCRPSERRPEPHSAPRSWLRTRRPGRDRDGASVDRSGHRLLLGGSERLDPTASPVMA
jgi:hypothetical protein